jgi:hypothetical protein
VAARAQQPERMRRIGALMNQVADDPEVKAWLTAFQEGLQQLDGRRAAIFGSTIAGLAAIKSA